MEAQFSSTCSACTREIRRGDQIKVGVRPAEHEVCPTQTNTTDEHDDGRQSDSAPRVAEATPAGDGGDERQPHSVPEPVPLPSMPAGATAEQLRAWLHEVEAQELAVKREEYLARVRPARSKLIEELLAHHDVSPIAGDRSEAKRLRLLRKKLLGDDARALRPRWHDESQAEQIRFAARSRPRRQALQDSDAGPR